MAQRGPSSWPARFWIVLVVLSLILPSVPLAPSAQAAGDLKDPVRDCNPAYIPGKRDEDFVPSNSMASEAAGARAGASASIQAPANPPNGSRAGFAGTWNTNYGALTLDVQDSNVTGAYEWYDGRLVGALSPDGRTLNGTWSMAPTFLPPGDGGKVLLRLAEDGQSLTGEWGYGDRLTDGKWAGVRLAPLPVGGDSAPAAPTLTRHGAPVGEPTSGSADPLDRWVGTWDTTRGVLGLHIEYENLIGKFGEEHPIWGKVSSDGRTFWAGWALRTERHGPPTDEGLVILHLLDNGLSFTGEWGTRDAPLDQPWSGTQASTAPPTATPTPVPNLSWTGTWGTMFGDLTLQTNGANVTGVYQDLDHGVLDGRVAGTLSADRLTLTGVWSQAPTHAPPDDAGTFVFEMKVGPEGAWWLGPRKRNDGTTIVVWSGGRMEVPAVALTPRPPTPAPPHSD